MSDTLLNSWGTIGKLQCPKIARGIVSVRIFAYLFGARAQDQGITGLRWDVQRRDKVHRQNASGVIRTAEQRGNNPMETLLW